MEVRSRAQGAAGKERFAGTILQSRESDDHAGAGGLQWEGVRKTLLGGDSGCAVEFLQCQQGVWAYSGEKVFLGGLIGSEDLKAQCGSSVGHG